MKKSLIALAVLGSFAGVAAAQSSVTIYGIVDMAVSKANTGNSNLSFYQDWQVGNRDQWVVRSGSSSRLGFRGTEDLGGGLKANFLIEHRFQPDTGGVEPRDGVTGTPAARTNNAGFWNAQTYVGLSSTSAGEVRMGRLYTPAFFIALATDPWGYEYNLAGFGGYTRGGNGVTTAYNAVSYISPTLAGFTASAQVAAGEGGAAASGSPSPGKNVGFSLTYAAGPLWVGLGYNDAKRDNSPIKNQSTVLGATYNFGVIKPIFNYSVGKNNVAGNATSKAMLIGAHIPVGNGFIRTGVGRYDPAVGVNPNASAFSPYNAYPVTNSQNTTKFGIGYVYNLSKRTSVSADIGTAKTETFSRSTGYQAALKHVF